MDYRIRSLLRELKAELQKIYVERLHGVYLYGSYARGDQDPESDSVQIEFTHEEVREMIERAKDFYRQRQNSLEPHLDKIFKTDIIQPNRMIQRL